MIDGEMCPKSGKWGTSSIGREIRQKMAESTKGGQMDEDRRDFRTKSTDAMDKISPAKIDVDAYYFSSMNDHHFDLEPLDEVPELDKQKIRALIEYVLEDPEEREILWAYFCEGSERKAGAKLGIAKSTFHRRFKKVWKKVEEKAGLFRELFE